MNFQMSWKRLMLHQFLKKMIPQKLKITDHWVYLCGYRKGFSTQQALASLIEKWKAILDKNGYAVLLLIDLSKAFDTINHDLLIAKLNAYGFTKNSLRLIKSYLSNRWQRTKINTSLSSWTELLLRVPQESALGTIALWYLY